LQVVRDGCRSGPFGIAGQSKTLNVPLCVCVAGVVGGGRNSIPVFQPFLGHKAQLKMRWTATALQSMGGAYDGTSQAVVLIDFRTPQAASINPRPWPHSRGATDMMSRDGPT
jgi:hypothetical protein